MEACIQKNNFNEAKCQQQVSHLSQDIDVLYQILSADGIQIDALYECCNLFYQKNGDDASTVSCPKANLLRYVCLQSSHTREHRGKGLTESLHQPQDAPTSTRAITSNQTGRTRCSEYCATTAGFDGAIRDHIGSQTVNKAHVYEKLICTVQKCFSRPIQSRAEYIEGQNSI